MKDLTETRDSAASAGMSCRRRIKSKHGNKGSFNSIVSFESVN